MAHCKRSVSQKTDKLQYIQIRWQHFLIKSEFIIVKLQDHSYMYISKTNSYCSQPLIYTISSLIYYYVERNSENPTSSTVIFSNDVLNYTTIIPTRKFKRIIFGHSIQTCFTFPLNNILFHCLRWYWF